MKGYLDLSLSSVPSREVREWPAAGTSQVSRTGAQGGGSEEARRRQCA